MTSHAESASQLSDKALANELDALSAYAAEAARRLRSTPSAKQATTEVGVLFSPSATALEAAEAAAAFYAGTGAQRVYTYDALASLELEIGDQVVCPVAPRCPGRQAQRLGVVATLRPRPTKHQKRLITERTTT